MKRSYKRFPVNLTLGLDSPWFRYLYVCVTMLEFTCPLKSLGFAIAECGHTLIRSYLRKICSDICNHGNFSTKGIGLISLWTFAFIFVKFLSGFSFELKKYWNKKAFQSKANRPLFSRSQWGGGPQVNDFEQVHLVITWGPPVDRHTRLKTSLSRNLVGGR